MENPTELRSGDATRRGWLVGLACCGAGTLLAPALAAFPLLVSASRSEAQPAAGGPQAIMARAMAQRELARQAGDQPYGAVVVLDNAIVGEAPSRVVTRHDPTAHAELEAIRDAASRLGPRGLGGALLYSTSRPCPMCEAAAYWAGIGSMIHGVQLSDAGKPRLPQC